VATETERRSHEYESSGGVGSSLLDELMTSSQVAELLQMRLSTVESYARRGLLPSVKVGRHRRFVRSHVERALASLIEGT
jgi:excisionase family DNA binding protein